MKKGEIEIDQLMIWLLALLVIVTLIFIVFMYREKMIELLRNFGNILRFGR